ncbi:hypothetical protein HBH98_256040 [Parastagonospora nodorum]|nr:hypothetical protein HBH51_259160 [Parastagonospora nodorum]KAH4215254.1 hypothetical protein HBI06_258380 [Parastagonospora nodorum]KAH4220926.1 hypothetical protein HBI05_256600 [Parastagonospora nodorum]KAH4330991.1 hypothetical protein HBH98_256040 [Parastagonospora nodorum]KAH4354199.1 hypothetical protein HBH97_254600 [Parastagonospora nodorum]
MGIMLVPIPTLAGLSDQGAEKKSFFVLSVVTAALLLLQSLNHLSFVCGLHSHHIKKPFDTSFSGKRASPNDLNPMPASLKRETARFEAFTHMPTTEVTRHVAYRFQDHREAFISEIAETHKDVATDSGKEVTGTATRSTAVLSVVLAAACILILISSLFLVKSLEADWMASEDVAVYAITFSSVLSDFAAAFTSRRTIFYPSPGEGLGLATRRSAAQLVAVILPLSVLTGWLFKAESLLLPFDAFYIAVWIVGLAIQTIGEGW